MKRLHISNFPYDTTEDDLRGAFSPHGDLREVKIVNDRDTGNSRGFGFVEFASETSAEAALAAWNGQDFRGRPLRVQEAVAREKDRDGGRRDDRRNDRRERRHRGG